MEERVVVQTVVGNYVVSTIDIDNPELRYIDGLIEGFEEIVGKEFVDEAVGPRPGRDVGSALEANYETMVFPAEDGDIASFTEVDCARYQTREEAVVGHAAMVERWSLLGSLESN